MPAIMILPDILVPGLHLVFCGTAPSRVSAAKGAYYANPGNAFWPTLARLGLVPAGWRAADFDRMNDLGLGLTDLNKVEIGNDADLTPDGFDVPGFMEKMRHHRPAGIAFTSKNGARLFLGAAAPIPWGRQPVDWEGVALFVLPSPSGQARRSFSLGPWQEAAAFVAARRGRSVIR
ncbi:mismatch-specific DNA-glycosylase [Niveispirillum fermenti]|uniref:mismatch-specific DNA-glycosylase n=1 Tax=Niveispirillum fermenti TaxID=1233113 RepID=UPI003A837E6E